MARTLKVFFSNELVAESGFVGSPSDRKPGLVAEALRAMPWPLEFVAPEPTPVEEVFRVHDPTYVEDVLRLRRRNGFGSMSPSVARSVLYTCGACHDSAVVALKEGISASLTSGFHHAGPSAGRGFCTFNGLMIAVSRLFALERVKRVAIIDGDFHYGDGTQAIIDHHQLAERVLHVSFGQTFRTPAQATDYLSAVSALRGTLERFRPDLILYQAGADVHRDDPLGGVLTTEQMRQRDRTLFTLARELAIPLSWNLAGGYQVEADGSIPRVIALHLDTFREALTAWGFPVADAFHQSLD